MRRPLLVMALGSLLLVSCGESLSNIDGTNWNFTSYEVTGSVVDVIPGTQPTIAFEGDPET